MPRLKINGVQLHVHVSGKGVPIIFVHPPLLTSSVFNYQKSVLSNVFKVITFDIRGHGFSDPSEAPLTYELIAEDMKQLLDHLEISQAFVCGYSTGGGIALEAMLGYPDRYAGGILLSAMPEASDWWLKARLSVATTLMRKPMDGLLRRMISWGNRDSRETFRQLLKTAKQGSAQNILEYYKYSKTYNCTNRLSRIRQPVLLVYGQKDRSFYRYAELLHHGLPKSNLYFMRDVGHQLPTRAGDRVNRLVSSWIAMQQEIPGLDGKAYSDKETGDKEREAFEKQLKELALYNSEWNENVIHSGRDI